MQVLKVLNTTADWYFKKYQVENPHIIRSPSPTFDVLSVCSRSLVVRVLHEFKGMRLQIVP